MSDYGLKPHTYPTVDGSLGVSEARGVLTVTAKDGEDKKSEKPVNPTEVAIILMLMISLTNQIHLLKTSRQ